MYIWRVWKDNRFAGYVSSASQFDAYLRATEQFGKNVWVERAVEYKVVYHPNNQDHFVGDSQPA
jgi:hypothetical protein